MKTSRTLKNARTPKKRMAMYGAYILALIGPTVFALLIGDDLLFGGIMALASLIFSMLILSFLNSYQGWKVFHLKMSRGMPLGMWIATGIFMAVMLFFYYLPPLFTGYEIFLLDLIVVVICNLLAWFIGIKNWIRGCGEIEARDFLAKKRYPPEMVNERIEQLRKIGLIVD